MATRLMTRVFAAVENQEDAVLNQIENDVDIALEDGFCDTAQYSIEKIDDKSAKIHDKLHNEDTIATLDDGTCKLSMVELDQEDIPTELPELILNQTVTWIDESGNTREGRLTQLNGDLVTIEPFDLKEGETVTLSRKEVRMLCGEDKEFAARVGNDNGVLTLIIPIGDYDVEFNTKTRKATLIDDKLKLSWQFNPGASLTSIIKDAEKKVKGATKNMSDYIYCYEVFVTEDGQLHKIKNDLLVGDLYNGKKIIKVLGDMLSSWKADELVENYKKNHMKTNNLSKMSEATQKHFSCKHRTEVKEKQQISNLDKLSPGTREMLKKKYNLN